MATEPTTGSTTTPGPPRAGWGAGRIALVIVGSLLALLGAGLLAGGCGLLWADQTQRDDDGYLTTPTERLQARSYAIVSEPIDLLEADTSGADWLLSEDVLGDVRVRASSNREVFIGIGPTSDVEAYLEGVGYHRLTDADFDPFRPRYEVTAGGRTRCSADRARLLGGFSVRSGRPGADLEPRHRRLVCRAR